MNLDFTGFLPPPPVFSSHTKQAAAIKSEEELKVDRKSPEIDLAVKQDFYAQLLEQTRPKQSGAVEPLFGFSNAQNLLATEAPPIVSSTDNTSLTPTFYQPESEPLFLPTTTTVEQNCQDFGFIVGSADTSDTTKTRTIDGGNRPFILERPAAPSPSVSHQMPIEDVNPGHANTHQQTSVADESTLRSIINFDETPNMIEWTTAQKKLAEMLVKYNIVWWDKGGKHVNWGPIGKQLKDNIIEIWKSHFTGEFLGPATIEMVESSPIRSATNETSNNAGITPISCCSTCNFIIDVVEFIRGVTNGEMYDGSSLEQLQRKMKMIKTVCPGCKSEETFSDPMFGYKAIPLVIGGTLHGARDDDENVITDPTLYKIAPSSLMQSMSHGQVEMKDPMTEFSSQPPPTDPNNVVEEITDTHSSTEEVVSKEPTDKDKHEEKKEEECNLTPDLAGQAGGKELFTHFLLPTNIYNLSNILDEVKSSIIYPHAGVASITSILKSCIGRSDHSSMTSVAEFHLASNITEACCLTTLSQLIQNGDGVDVEDSIIGRSCFLFNKEDQYLKKTRPRKVALDSFKTPANPGTGLGYFTNKVLRFINAVIRFEAIKSEHRETAVVFRELLPCESFLCNLGEGSNAWNVEIKVHGDQEPTSPIIIGQLFVIKNGRVGLRIEIESLLYAAILSGMREDYTRTDGDSSIEPTIWFRPFLSVAPYTVLLTAIVSEEKTQADHEKAGQTTIISKHLRTYAHTLRIHGISVHTFWRFGTQLEMEVVADELGIPFLLSLDASSNLNDDISTFEVPVTLRSRDQPHRRKKLSLMELDFAALS